MYPTEQVESSRYLLAACPICEGRRLHYTFSRHGYRVVRCADCRLLMLNPQPNDAEYIPSDIPTAISGHDVVADRQRLAAMHTATAHLYLDQIKRYRGGQSGGHLLEIGCGSGEFLFAAQQANYNVTGVESSASAAKQAHARLSSGTIICSDVEHLPFEDATFDVCVLSHVIERVRNPLTFLHSIQRLLKPGGMVFITTPSLDSWSARLLQQNWMKFKPDHLFYFDSNTLQNALYRTGFADVVMERDWKIRDLDYAATYFNHFPLPLLAPLAQQMVSLLPNKIRHKFLPIVTSGMIALASSKEIPQRHKVSVVVPAFNEAATFEQMMNALLHKEIPGLDIEVVVVESNSTDGTREVALQYESHPRVRLVLEDRPQGKGHAVRTGFDHATGDFILIQDADLEYDLEDYDVLLEPLMQGREAFVLGSRHGGNTWKMRHFAEQRSLSTALNAGHWFFTTLVNVLFGQRLKDPFTMYKVFRRDCLFGLTFACNRFDFDYELLIKLVRKGYKPIEIPVNYRSRSFREGKKVSVFRDPLTWLKALAWLRVVPIDPLKEAELQHSRQRVATHELSAQQSKREIEVQS